MHAVRHEGYRSAPAKATGGSEHAVWPSISLLLTALPSGAALHDEGMLTQTAVTPAHRKGHWRWCAC